MRFLIFSHAHPAFSKGGGELAAWYQYQGINATNDHQAWFVGRAPRELLSGGVEINAISPSEFLMAGDADCWTLSTSINLDDNSRFAELLRSIQPDVIHFHHYLYVGVETIRAAKRLCPQARIVLTLHEYVAICNHNGQMIKKDGRLCYRSSPRDCHLCFPEQTPEDFFLREQYVKSFFRLVDLFISPSQFLKDRYVAWGLSDASVQVLENGLPQVQRIPPRPLAEQEVRGRFAYFGQINPYKGSDVLIEAFAHLPKKIRKIVSLDIYGAGLHTCPEEYQEKIRRLLQDNKKVVHFHGPYEPSDLPALMSATDWVVMGSIWWENSPLVIQESIKYGRPVICPDIGGMAEKVANEETGLHFRARDARSLGQTIQRVVSDVALFDKLLRKLPIVPSVEVMVEQYLAILERLVRDKTGISKKRRQGNRIASMSGT